MKLLIFMHYLKVVLRFFLPSDSIRHFYLHPSPRSFNYHGHSRLMTCQILVGVVLHSVCVSTTDVCECVCVRVCVMTIDKALTSCRHLSRSMNESVPPHLSFPAGPMHPLSAAPLLSLWSILRCVFLLLFSFSDLSFITSRTSLSLSQVITCLPFAWCASVAVWLKVKICHVALRVLCIAVTPSPPWHLEHTQPEGKQL